MTEINVPVVLSFSGLDPTGGAGIQADIEALGSQGCHCAPIITALTVQDTRDAKAVTPVAADIIVEQARTILEDMPVNAIKIGLVPDAEVAMAIQSVLIDYPSIPVVLDPVIRAGGGTSLTTSNIIDALRTHLLPLVTILTPNSEEIMQIAANADSIDAAASELTELGTEFVLVTGTHKNTPKVENTLYYHHRIFETFKWERLPDEYHGSGCTLAACTAGLLAQGAEPLAAVHQAQEYTWRTLKHSYHAGMGQKLPNRLFWAQAR